MNKTYAGYSSLYPYRTFIMQKKSFISNGAPIYEHLTKYYCYITKLPDLPDTLYICL